MTKIRGLCLKSSVNEDKINDNLFDFYIEQYDLSNTCSKKINQFRLKRLKHNQFQFQIHPHIEPVTFTNDVSKKRYVDLNSNNFVTLPYGFI